MEWIRRHTDTVIVLGAVISSMLWMNSRFNEIEKDLAVIKAVLVMRNIMPTELAMKKKVNENNQ